MKFKTAALIGLATSFLSSLSSAQSNLSLQEKLDARRDAFLERADESVIKSQKKALSQIEESGIYKRVLKVGDKAPDFTLGNANGVNVKLSNVLKKGPVVLTWYRGGWCPYCNIALKELSEKNETFNELDATLIALTPELPDTTLSSIETLTLPFEVLSDIGHGVADKYGLVFNLNAETEKRYEAKFHLNERSGDAATGKLPLPATYVINKEGIITYAFVDADYRRRAEPARIVDALKAIKHGPTGRHLLLQFWENTWNPPYDLDLIDRNMSEDFILTSAGNEIKGREAFKNWVKVSLDKAPGLRIENLDCFENKEGNRIVSRWVCRANSGAIPDEDKNSSENKPIQFTGIAVWEFKDGKLTHNWVERSAAKKQQ